MAKRSLDRVQLERDLAIGVLVEVEGVCPPDSPTPCARPGSGGPIQCQACWNEWISKEADWKEKWLAEREAAHAQA